VVIAPDRALRPIALNDAQPIHRRDRDGRAVCPFCEGHEYDTPGEVYAIRKPESEPNGPGWSLRVVPNKFPAVGGDAGGIHECVIETATHVTNPTRLSDEQFAVVLLAWRDRTRQFARDDRLLHVTPFKNVGAEAGASLAHLHSQIIALPFVPEAVREEMDGAERYFHSTGRCVFCDEINEQEDRSPSLTLPARTVFTRNGFVAFCPYAPRFGYETWVIPKAHASNFETLTDEAALDLARMLKRLLIAIDAVLAEPAYNLFLHTAPLRTSGLRYYHWHIEIIPRTSRPAGFEWGSGVFINAVPPERGASELRIAMNR
jgi:UDPglucose--hexose-1-phosphate uridylyltransferase